MLRVTMNVSAGFMFAVLVRCRRRGLGRACRAAGAARMHQGRGQSGDGTRALHRAARRRRPSRRRRRGGAALQKAGRREGAVELQPELHTRSGGDVGAHSSVDGKESCSLRVQVQRGKFNGASDGAVSISNLPRGWQPFVCLPPGRVRGKRNDGANCPWQRSSDPTFAGAKPRRDLRAAPVASSSTRPFRSPSLFGVSLAIAFTPWPQEGCSASEAKRRLAFSTAPRSTSSTATRCAAAAACSGWSASTRRRPATTRNARRSGRSARAPRRGCKSWSRRDGSNSSAESLRLPPRNGRHRGLQLRQAVRQALHARERRRIDFLDRRGPRRTLCLRRYLVPAPSRLVRRVELPAKRMHHGRGNPVTGRVLCIEPLGDAVEPPPPEAALPCKRPEDVRGSGSTARTARPRLRGCETLAGRVERASSIGSQN